MNKMPGHMYLQPAVGRYSGDGSSARSDRKLLMADLPARQGPITKILSAEAVAAMTSLARVNTAVRTVTRTSLHSLCECVSTYARVSRGVQLYSSTQPYPNRYTF